MIKIGIVGLGGMGTVHFKNYQHIDKCKVVGAVCNSESSRQKAVEYGLRPYRSVMEMIENEEIHVVDVCTPTYLHKKHVIEALNLGKHVIVEKPIALNTKDAIDMYDLAEAKNLRLFVGHVVQFTKETEILKSAIKGGKYGKPLDGYFKRLASKPKWVKDGWLFDKEKSGLLPFDLHVHDLELILSIFGEPFKFNFTSCGRPDASYKEAYRINYAFDGLNVTVEAAWYNASYPFTAAWRVYFERAVLEYDGKNVILYEPDKEPYYYDLEEEFTVETGINLPPTGMFYRELSHFIQCIENNLPSEIVNKAQVIKGVEIMEELIKNE
jgi:predicted dehydrogenase